MLIHVFEAIYILSSLYHCPIIKPTFLILILLQFAGQGNDMTFPASHHPGQKIWNRALVRALHWLSLYSCGYILGSKEQLRGRTGERQEATGHQRTILNITPEIWLKGRVQKQDRGRYWQRCMGPVARNWALWKKMRAVEQGQVRSPRNNVLSACAWGKGAQKIQICTSCLLIQTKVSPESRLEGGTREPPPLNAISTGEH